MPKQLRCELCHEVIGVILSGDCTLLCMKCTRYALVANAIEKVEEGADFRPKSV